MVVTSSFQFPIPPQRSVWQLGGNTTQTLISEYETVLVLLCCNNERTPRSCARQSSDASAKDPTIPTKANLFHSHRLRGARKIHYRLEQQTKNNPHPTFTSIRSLVAQDLPSALRLALGPETAPSRHRSLIAPRLC